MNTKTLLIVGAAIVAIAVLAKHNGASAAVKGPATPPPQTQNTGFGASGAGMMQSAPGGTMTTVNSSIAVANNALGFYNNLSALWSDEDNSDG